MSNGEVPRRSFLKFAALGIASAALPKKSQASDAMFGVARRSDALTSAKETPPVKAPRQSHVNRIRLSAALLTICGVLGATMPAYATHFRYGNLTWTPVSGRTVKFHLTDAFRRSASPSFDPCVNPASASPYTVIACDWLVRGGPREGEHLAWYDVQCGARTQNQRGWRWESI